MDQNRLLTTVVATYGTVKYTAIFKFNSFIPTLKYDPTLEKKFMLAFERTLFNLLILYFSKTQGTSTE